LKILNITHGDDTDGLCCAAILRHLKDAEVLLANYDNFEEILVEIKPQVDEVYITDLNIREALIQEIKRINDFTQLTIIDHHPIVPKVYNELVEMGISLIYDIKDCAGVLVYDHFKDQLPREAAKLAAYAAVSDMFENGPISSAILSRLDRKFTSHQALILTHSIQYNSSQEFKKEIVEKLSKFEYPHKIKGTIEASLSFLDIACKIIETLPDRAVRVGRIAYMFLEGDESTGMVANLILDTLGVDVGVCYKITGKYANISLRGERNLKEHLGKMAHKLAKKYSGFGGGHHRAGGVKIPMVNIGSFISDLANQLE
jgi:oligoribonuclease NrnB/cAMP/cGMP phosphodiesterase (DHH superfamily)